MKTYLLILLILSCLITYSQTNYKRASLDERISKLSGDLSNLNQFRAYARLYSEDAETTNDGGYLGSRLPLSFELQIKKQLKTLKPGNVSQWIKTDKGAYLFYLDKKRIFWYKLYMIYLRP